jgi:hypothetical protein
LDALWLLRRCYYCTLNAGVSIIVDDIEERWVLVATLHLLHCLASLGAVCAPVVSPANFTQFQISHGVFALVANLSKKKNEKF